MKVHEIQGNLRQFTQFPYEVFICMEHISRSYDQFPPKLSYAQRLYTTFFSSPKDHIDLNTIELATPVAQNLGKK